MGFPKTMVGNVGPGSAQKETDATKEKMTFNQCWNTILMPIDDFDMSRFKQEFELCWEIAQREAMRK